MTRPRGRPEPPAASPRPGPGSSNFLIAEPYIGIRWAREAIPRRGRVRDLTAREVRISTPLYLPKAEFFKTLGHSARIRVLELLSQRERAVGEMLPEVGIETANLSQHLAVLRRVGLVATRKEGSAVVYSLTSPEVAELLRMARQILTGVLSGQAELLDDLRA